MFEPKKFNDIVEDMGGRISGLGDFNVGSVTRTLVETFSYELGLLYEKMNFVYLSAFIDSAEGINLEQVVAALGIQRGQPDYAAGIVVFERDPGKDTILIPVNTLVATEEGPGKTKKVYRTIEEKTMGPGEVTKEVKIQAMERGEEFDAADGEIVVMPRPLPGIKSVVNKGKVLLTGRRRETDQELRERAKNTLISSGKATLLSIENALLSLPEVLDAKVVEDFIFPQGVANFSLKNNTNTDIEITVPRNSLIVGSNGISLRTKVEIFLNSKQSNTESKVQALLEGRVGEITNTNYLANLKFKDERLNKAILISNVQSVVLSDFGVIDVYLVGPDLTVEKKRAEIMNVIDRVKSAGVYVRLNNAQSVQLDGIFRIDAGTTQSMSIDELHLFEERVEKSILNFIAQIRMGKPLVFSRLLKEIIAVEGVDNLTDFRIFTRTERYKGIKRIFELSANKIEIEESDRFEPRHILVAASDKKLPVDVEIHVPNIDEDNFAGFKEIINNYFESLLLGQIIIKEEIIKVLNNKSFTVSDPNTLRLTPKPWRERGDLFIYENTTNEIVGVDVSFVERAVVGAIFAYSHYLEITGALLVMLTENLEPNEIDDVLNKIRVKIDSYLEESNLSSEINLDDLIAKATSASEYIKEIKYEKTDFQTVLTQKNGTPSNSTKLNKNPIIKSSIPKKQFQKPILKADCFFITNEIESEVKVSVVKINLNLNNGSLNNDTEKNNIKANLAKILSGFMKDPKIGQDFIFSELLDDMKDDSKYKIIAFEVEAKSKDGRKQERSIDNKEDIHIRSLEKVSIIPLDVTHIHFI